MSFGTTLWCVLMMKPVCSAVLWAKGEGDVSLSPFERSLAPRHTFSFFCASSHQMPPALSGPAIPTMFWQWHSRRTAPKPSHAQKTKQFGFGMSLQVLHPHHSTQRPTFGVHFWGSRNKKGQDRLTFA